MTLLPTEIARSLPLKPTDFLILLMLGSGERHGYRIMQDIAQQTDGDVRLEAGHLYRSLRRLLDRGFVDESEQRPAPDIDDERRRYYRLTPLGRRVLGAEAGRLRSLVRLAESQHLIDPETAP